MLNLKLIQCDHLVLRFGTASTLHKSVGTGKSEEQKRKDRAERFSFVSFLHLFLLFQDIGISLPLTCLYDVSQNVGNLIRQMLRPTFLCCFSDLGWLWALLLMRRQRRKLVWLGFHQTPSQILWKKIKRRQGQSGQEEGTLCHARLPLLRVDFNCLL